MHGQAGRLVADLWLILRRCGDRCIYLSCLQPEIKGKKRKEKEEVYKCYAPPKACSQKIGVYYYNGQKWRQPVRGRVCEDPVKEAGSHGNIKYNSMSSFDDDNWWDPFYIVCILLLFLLSRHLWCQRTFQILPFKTWEESTNSLMIQTNDRKAKSQESFKIIGTRWA